MDANFVLSILSLAAESVKSRPAATAVEALQDITTVADGLIAWVKAQSSLDLQITAYASAITQDRLRNASINASQYAASVLGVHHAPSSVGTVTYSTGDAS